MKIQIILHQSIYYDIIKCGVLRHYPNPEIASSWDADWNTSIKNIDCSGISTGPNMASNTGEGAGTLHDLQDTTLDVDRYFCNTSSSRRSPLGLNSFKNSMVL